MRRRNCPTTRSKSETLFESTRPPLRWIRKLLNPILKLFFNPNPLIQALNIQSRLNTMYGEREARREATRRAFDQLQYELMHNLVIETTRMSIEVKNLKMRVESLASRLEFNERRARALESVVVYKPSADDAPEAMPPVPAPVALRPSGAPGASGTESRLDHGAAVRHRASIRVAPIRPQTDPGAASHCLPPRRHASRRSVRRLDGERRSWVGRSRGQGRLSGQEQPKDLVSAAVGGAGVADDAAVDRLQPSWAAAAPAVDDAGRRIGFDRIDPGSRGGPRADANACSVWPSRSLRRLQQLKNVWKPRARAPLRRESETSGQTPPQDSLRVVPTPDPGDVRLRPKRTPSEARGRRPTLRSGDQRRRRTARAIHRRAPGAPCRSRGPHDVRLRLRHLAERTAGRSRPRQRGDGAPLSGQARAESRSSSASVPSRSSKRLIRLATSSTGSMRKDPAVRRSSTTSRSTPRASTTFSSSAIATTTRTTAPAPQARVRSWCRRRSAIRRSVFRSSPRFSRASER